MPTAVERASHIELPPPAWGSPAHRAQQRQEKEWATYLYAHASHQAAQRAVGKQSHFVEEINVAIYYTLPPVWPEPRSEETKWDIPDDDDELLIRILNASWKSLGTLTGDFAKVSGVFKTPSVSRPRSPVLAESVASAVPAATTTPPHPINRSPPPTVIVTSANDTHEAPRASAKPRDEPSRNIRPRRTYLPLFLTSFFARIGRAFIWLIPSPIRAWWSPVQSNRPIGRP